MIENTERQPSRLAEAPPLHSGKVPSWSLALAALLACCCLNGCAALSNPVAGGVPVDRLPPEVLGFSREEQIAIPLTQLRQKPIEVYLLETGDFLGVWIEGVLGNQGSTPPVTPPPLGSNLPPSLGFPIPVLEDGTILLPLIDPVAVRGLTVGEVRDKLRRAYTYRGAVGLTYLLGEWGFTELGKPFGDADVFGIGREILKPGGERILVDLQRPRLSHILVIRQDAGGVSVSGTGSLGSSKRGSGFQLDLPAGENDVLNALARTGGFPGLEAKNEVVVERPADKDRIQDPASLDKVKDYASKGEVPPGWGGGERIRIPLRLRPDQPLPFDQEDIILRTGDVLYIEDRDPDVYYTAGLLGSRQFILPRDYDLTVLDAIMLAGGVLFSGGSQTGSLTGSVVTSGLGDPSPSLVTVLRRTPDGGQLRIRVDLYKAMRDPRERVLVQAKDIILMQEAPGDAVVRYMTQIINFGFSSTLFQRRDASMNGSFSIP